jgi:hypothetical protein
MHRDSYMRPFLAKGALTGDIRGGRVVPQAILIVPGSR